MIPLLTAAQVRELDRIAIEEVGIPGLVLMESAGRALAAVAEEMAPPGSRVVILCGKGNNGGDGFVAARILHDHERLVACIITAPLDEHQSDALHNLMILLRLGVPVVDWAGPEIDDGASDEVLRLVPPDFDGDLDDDEDFESDDYDELEVEDYGPEWLIEHAELLIDCLLGTGATGAPRGAASEILDAMMFSEAAVLACDLPTGVEADTGERHKMAVEADRTCSFAAWKIGLVVGPGAVACGRVDACDIGIPRAAYARVGPPAAQLWQAADAAGQLPYRAPDCHKGEAGRVLVLGGSPGFGGAPVMAATAALKAGAGLVTLGLPDSLAAYLPAVPVELMTRLLPGVDGELGPAVWEAVADLAAAAGAVAIGPGLGRSQGSGVLVQLALRNHPAVVLDADALHLLQVDKTLRDRGRSRIITPHPGEAARLLGQRVDTVQRDRLKAAARLAERYHSVVVLKGHHTIVADKQQTPVVIPTGTPAMAVGGMGDALTGVIAALLAQGVEPFAAACLGAWLHGSAGEIAAAGRDSGLLASELITALPAARQALLELE